MTEATVQDEFGGVTITTETRDSGKAPTPVEQIPASVKSAVDTANADRTRRVVVGPLADKVMATRFAGLAQSYGVNFPGGRVTVRATVRDDNSVAITVADYVKRTLEQGTKDKMRIAKLEAALSKAKASRKKADIDKAQAALDAANTEIANRDAA